MALNDMTEADKQFLRMEIRSALRPFMDKLMDELTAIRMLLEKEEERPATFAYAYAKSGGTADDAEVRRREAMELYDGAAIEKEEKKHGELESEGG